jgi:hypothetical protein
MTHWIRNQVRQPARARYGDVDLVLSPVNGAGVALANVATAAFLAALPADLRSLALALSDGIGLRTWARRRHIGNMEAERRRERLRAAARRWRRGRGPVTDGR